MTIRNYIGKEIEFKAQAFRPKGMGEDMFVPVRKFMTCCADDMRYYGYPCKLKKSVEFRNKEWVKIRARFEFEAVVYEDSRQPILYLIDIESTEKPEEEIVYLG